MIETKYVIVMEDGKYYCSGGLEMKFNLVKAANIAHASIYPIDTNEADYICNALLENGYKCRIETVTIPSE